MDEEIQIETIEVPIKSIAVSTETIQVLTEKNAAKYIGMSRSFLNQDRMNGYRIGRTPGPRFMKFGHAIRYRKKDLDEWLEKHLVIRDPS